MDDSTVAVECIRRGVKSVQQIVQAFVNCGIPFATLRVLSSDMAISQDSSENEWWSLGSRPKGYTPTIVDYAAYEARRDSLLSSSRGQAAVLRGGVQWRLAKEHVSMEDILEGPSQPTRRTSSIVKACEGNVIWYDDAFTEQEEDLISGVYEILTTFRKFSHNYRLQYAYKHWD